MSASTISQNLVASKTFNATPARTARQWVRNPSWLTFTAPTEFEQKFVGLHAVWPESNFCALVAAGNYTVDWGDGNIENVAANTVAHHQYDFTDADLANTNAPVTFTDSTDLVTRNSHGYSNDMIVVFYNIVSTTGIVEGQTYFVINAMTNTFQISATVGGSAIVLTTDGSATLLPYKQAVVTVTPQAGQDLTYLNLNQRHNQTGLQAYCSGFVDIAVASSLLTDFRVGASLPNSTTQNINFNNLEQVNVVRSDCRQLSNLFSASRSLQSVVNLATSTAAAQSMSVTFTDTGDLVTSAGHDFRNGDGVIFTNVTTTAGITAFTLYYVINATTDTFKLSASYGGAAVNLVNDGTGTALRGTIMLNTFINCSSLTTVPLFNTAAVTSMSNMFQGCPSLTTVPLFNTAAVTSMSNMFNSCPSLTTVPLFNTAAVTIMSFMFNSCPSLTTVPLFNTAAVTIMSNMFSSCSSLTTVPLFNTAAVTNMSSMFSSCPSLTTVPLFNTAAVTNMTSMFQNCPSLTTVPLFNTAAVTNMSSMFQQCSSLTTVPLFNTAAVTNMDTMFSSCPSLTTVPLFNTAAVTSMSNMFSSCPSLTTVPLFNTAAVTNMFSMFQGCTSLTTVPLFNTAAVTSMFSMFQNCPSLTTVPLFNTAAVTSMSSMFSGCSKLITVPLFNTAAVTNMSFMFNSCTSLTTVPALITTGVGSGNFNSIFATCPNLSSIQAKNFRFTFSVTACKLSAAALNEIYTNLPTVTSQTITVTQNWGTLTDTPTIATAKGWTVTG
jgi:surface protein